MSNLSAGYIIQDKDGNAIYGFGSSVDEAWKMAVDGAGPFFDAYGDEIPEDVAYTTKFKAYGATKALLEEVERKGGAISWGCVNGVACTNEEEEQSIYPDARVSIVGA